MKGSLSLLSIQGCGDLLLIPQWEAFHGRVCESWRLGFGRFGVNKDRVRPAMCLHGIVSNPKELDRAKAYAT